MQTFPADWLLVLVPFLHGSSDITRALILTVFMWFVHMASFGENSLFDFTQGYDKSDPAKKDHPLEQGSITVHGAINIILWGKTSLMVIGCLLTVLWSPSPLWSMFGLFMWYSWGTAYNLGLSKESLFGFLPISICFASMGAWAWLLSHSELGALGWTYLAFVFFTILFQISYEGFLKELEIKERSNILIKLGAKIIDGRFNGGWGKWFGLFMKVVNLILGFLLIPTMERLSYKSLWFIILAGMSLLLTYKLIRNREWNRNREVLLMSLQEICVIYIPILILLDLTPSIILMLFGTVYFFGMNRILWKKSHPAV